MPSKSRRRTAFRLTLAGWGTMKKLARAGSRYVGSSVGQVSFAVVAANGMGHVTRCGGEGAAGPLARPCPGSITLIV
jgi:hypothetical protein